MQPTHSLKQKLTTFLPWHPSRIELTALAIFGILQICSVNLSKIARTMGHEIEIDSHRKRLKRFFAWNRMSLDDIARLVVQWMVPDGGWILCLDRTNWQFGKFKINILMLAIAYKGTAIPIIWKLLPKKGNSNTHERIRLMKRFIALFGKDNILFVTADREFKGKKWMEWLISQNIPYRIRIANNTLISGRTNGRKLKAYRYFPLQRNESMALNKPRELWGIKTYISCYRSEKEYVIVISNEKGRKSLLDYMRRWEIETLFQALKSRGFDLESTHLKDRKRVARLLGILTLAYCWAYAVGEWRAEKKPIKKLKHGRSSHTIFRYGLELLASMIFGCVSSFKPLLYHIQFFGEPRKSVLNIGEH